MSGSVRDADREVALVHYSPDRLDAIIPMLFTFARNQAARRLYERHGFIAMAHGFEPGWQLEDVMSMWTGGAGVARFPPSVARP